MNFKNYTYRFLFIFIYIFFISKVSYTQSGTLDTSFGNGGILNIDYGGNEVVGTVLIQPDGKIIAEGPKGGVNQTYKLLARFQTDGSADLSFGQGGSVETPIRTGVFSEAEGLAVLQPDGKILITNYRLDDDTLLLRYLPTGVLDSSFGVNGIANKSYPPYYNARASGIALQSDGKILISGTTTTPYSAKEHIYVARYLTNGSLDTTFANMGMQTTLVGLEGDLFAKIALQPDGKIVIAATYRTDSFQFRGCIVRYNNSGSLDATFGIGGIVKISPTNLNEQIRSIALQPDGKIVIGGHCDNTVGQQQVKDFMLVRCLSNGILDSTFGVNGKSITLTDSADQCFTIALLQDGNIIAGGNVKSNSLYDFMLQCYKPNGSIDSTFGINGIVQMDIDSTVDWGLNVVVQNDNKIILGGTSIIGGNSNENFTLLRFNYGEEEEPQNPDEITEIVCNSLFVYPNPFSTFTTFRLQQEVSDATLILSDISGKQVKQMMGIQGNEIRVNRGSLPSGFYTAQLFQKDKIIAISKLIIMD